MRSIFSYAFLLMDRPLVNNEQHRVSGKVLLVIYQRLLCIL